MVRVQFKVRCETRLSNVCLRVVGDNEFLGNWNANLSQLQLYTDESAYPWWSGSCQLSDLSIPSAHASSYRATGSNVARSHSMTGKKDSLLASEAVSAYFNFATVTQQRTCVEDKIKHRCIPGPIVAPAVITYQGEFNLDEASLSITSRRRQVMDLRAPPPATPPATPPTTPVAARRKPQVLPRTLDCFFAHEASPPSAREGTVAEEVEGEAWPERGISQVQRSFRDRGLLESGMAAYSQELPICTTEVPAAAGVWERLRRSASAALHASLQPPSSAGSGAATQKAPLERVPPQKAPSERVPPQKKPARLPNSGRHARMGGA